MKWLLGLGLVLSVGCVSQAEVDRAARDQLEFSTRLVGYALESNNRTLKIHRALLAAFPPESEAHATVVELLGDEAALVQLSERLATDRADLIQRGAELKQQYGSAPE